MAPFPINVIRTVFAAGEHVAPNLTGRAAFELFRRTPSARRMTAGERRAVAAASEFMAEARHHRLTTRSGVCVVAHEFRPSRLERRGRGGRNTVLVVHGWRSRTEYMRAIIAGFLDAGMRVVSIDLPGHGHSSGRKLDLALGVEAARTAADWFGPFAGIVGHSLGGAVAVHAVAGWIEGVAPIDAGAVVTIAAPNALSPVFEGFGNMLHLGPKQRRAMADRVRQISGHPLSSFESRQHLARVPVPALIVHDEKDAEVPVQDALTAASAGKHVALRVTRGLGHRRIIADPDVVAAAVCFVSQAAGQSMH